MDDLMQKARELARTIIVDVFDQTISDKNLDRVAVNILKAVPGVSEQLTVRKCRR